MIKIEPAEEPSDFEKKVRKPGLAYLAAHPGKEPKSLWNNCRSDMYNAYGGYCAYTTFKINSRLDAVVDHFLPKSSHVDKVYEWSNFRLSSFHVNSVKKDSENIVDPFKLPENAFHLEEDMILAVNDGAFLSEEECTLAHETIKRLKLNSRELIDDRNEMLIEFLRIKKEYSDVHSKQILACLLNGRSRFLYQEAVRLKYIEPLEQ